jgi:BASS family bile acid:Na+ symporter
MGLMLAATEGALPGTTWLYFALAQFPLYMSPQLLRPLARQKTDAERQLSAHSRESGNPATGSPLSRGRADVK